MIEGIKIDMAEEELREHVQVRAAYHVAKAKFYADQANNLRAGGVQVENASNDPISSMEGKHETHARRVAFFRLLEKYLVAGETYRLGENDLSRLEFVERWY